MCILKAPGTLTTHNGKRTTLVKPDTYPGQDHNTHLCNRAKNVSSLYLPPYLPLLFPFFSLILSLKAHTAFTCSLAQSKCNGSLARSSLMRNTGSTYGFCVVLSACPSLGDLACAHAGAHTCACARTLQYECATSSLHTFATGKKEGKGSLH